MEVYRHPYPRDLVSFHASVPKRLLRAVPDVPKTVSEPRWVAARGECDASNNIQTDKTMTVRPEPPLHQRGKATQNQAQPKVVSLDSVEARNVLVPRRVLDGAVLTPFPRVQKSSDS